jgi:hypothetical protein
MLHLKPLEILREKKILKKVFNRNLKGMWGCFTCMQKFFNL